MSEEAKPEYDYFYIVFTLGGGIWCSTVLKQHKGPNGFNFANAHAYLMGRYKMSLVVTQYFEINERRYEEFKKFMAGQPQEAGKPSLTVHQGGGEAAEKKPGEVTPLRPVAPPAPLVDEKHDPNDGPESAS